MRYKKIILPTWTFSIFLVNTIKPFMYNKRVHTRNFNNNNIKRSLCCGSMKMNRELTRGVGMECVVPVKCLRGSDTR